MITKTPHLYEADRSLPLPTHGGLDYATAYDLLPSPQQENIVRKTTLESVLRTELFGSVAASIGNTGRNALPSWSPKCL